MSDTAIYIIPSSPHYVPDAVNRNLALEYFRKVSPLRGSGQYYFEIYETPAPLKGRVVCLQHSNDNNNSSNNNSSNNIINTSNEKLSSESNLDDNFSENTWEIDSSQSSPIKAIYNKRIYSQNSSQEIFSQFAIGALNPCVTKYWEDEKHLKLETLGKLQKLLGCTLTVVWVSL